MYIRASSTGKLNIVSRMIIVRETMPLLRPRRRLKVAQFLYKITAINAIRV